MQPWRLAGGSARARMLCTPAQPAAAEGGAAMLKNALNWAGENRTVVGVLFGVGAAQHNRHGHHAPKGTVRHHNAS